jgi:ubiquinone biosynthesis protein
MLRETLSMVRDLPRLHEITSVLIRYGWGDFVRLLGIANLLERAGRLLHWKTTNEITQLDLPVRIRLALTELGPSFVKLGQILATRVDVFPPSWIAEFEKLHSHVPPVPFELLRPELEKVLGGRSIACSPNSSAKRLPQPPSPRSIAPGCSMVVRWW